MNAIELANKPVAGEDGWVELFGEISEPDDTPMQVYCVDGNAQQGHAIEFRNGYIRGYKIEFYKILPE